MYLKWIVCTVPEARREAFSRAQREWSAIRFAEGLIGQVGGFSATGEACVLAAWTSEGAYSLFLEHVHDAVTHRNQQADTYTRIEVTLARSLLRMPGAAEELGDALRTARALRVADCRVRAGRAEHFVHAQANVWAPGMAQSPGMLGGAFSVDAADPSRFLVTTLWSDPEAHDAYRAGPFAELRRRAAPDDDLGAIAGMLVHIEPAWTVIGTA